MEEVQDMLSCVKESLERISEESISNEIKIWKIRNYEGYITTESTENTEIIQSL